VNPTHRRAAVLVILALLIMSMTGCALFTKTPGQVVKAAWMTANAGQYQQAEKYLSTEVKKSMRGGLIAVFGGMNNIWDIRTRHGSIAKIDILKEEVRGDHAKVFFRVHFKNGETKDEDETMIKEKGEWKIAMS
jgi:Domain of unknown function (DUF4878)